MSCIYTAQGELVCTKGDVIETFYEETPNGGKKQESSDLIKNALQKEYCSIEVDNKTGQMRFIKDCKDSR